MGRKHIQVDIECGFDQYVLLYIKINNSFISSIHGLIWHLSWLWILPQWTFVEISWIYLIFSLNRSSTVNTVVFIDSAIRYKSPMNLDVVYNLINLNSTLDALGIYTETILGAVLSASLSLKSTLLSAVRPLSSSVPIVEFTELQFTLLKIIISIFFLNIFLILVYWRKYGEIITDRFIRPSMLRVALITDFVSRGHDVIFIYLQAP